MFDVVVDIINKVTGKTGITPETDFVSDLELNSFDVMNIICEFEEHFNVTIPTRDVWKLKNVGDVLKYMEEHGFTEK